jgi:hypothetical protein
LSPNISDSIDAAIVKGAVKCINDPTCFKWAAVYHNFSNLMQDFEMEFYRAMGDWTDENNSPLLCEIEGEFFRTLD